MTPPAPRMHLRLEAETHRALGLERGAALRAGLPEASESYERLFRLIGVSEQREREGVEAVLDTLSSWRPAAVAELEGIAAGSGVALERVVALNARTEIIALGDRAAHECSTLTSIVDGQRVGAQTWDWHIEFDGYWHTQEVRGPGYRFVGLTEQGIVSKIGVNEAGLALHFNILGHADDRPSGVPMHVLSKLVLSECATVAEALECIRDAPITSSSAFTLLDGSAAVSVEMSPGGVYPIDERDGSVQRTNHFQHDAPRSGEKSEMYEPDSSERLTLVRERLGEDRVERAMDLVELLVSGEGEPPLTCVADMSKALGERWATLATVITEPDARRMRVFDGMPPEALGSDEWRVLTA